MSLFIGQLRSGSPRFVLPLLVLVLIAFHVLPWRRANAISANIVISEFRTVGPNGGSDEFVELYNLSGSPVDIGGWKINGSNATGGVSTRLTITLGTIIPPFGHFLATNSSASGGPTVDRYLETRPTQQG